MLPLGLRKFCTLVEAERDEGVWTASAQFGTLEVSRALDGNLQHADCSVNGLARQHLLQVEREDIRLVHHRAKDTVNGVADESRQTRNLQSNAHVGRGYEAETEVRPLTLPISNPNVSPPIGFRT